MDEIKHIRIGLIINTHGVRGELKVMPLTDDKHRFGKLKHVMLDSDGKGTMIAFDVEGVKYPAEFIALKLKGIDTHGQAAAYKNRYVCIDKKDAAKLPKHSYYIYDLVGCEVTDQNGSVLGTVSDVISTGSNDVYVIKKMGTPDVLLPALKSLIVDVDTARKKIKAIVPEGLTE